MKEWRKKVGLRKKEWMLEIEKKNEGDEIKDAIV